MIVDRTESEEMVDIKIEFALIRGKLIKGFKEAFVKLEQCDRNLKAIAACQTLEELNSIHNTKMNSL